MFGSLGGPELFLILVVALIVFGPRKLPEIGKSLGKMMAEFRKASNDFRRTIEEEVEADKIREATRIDMSPVPATTAAATTATATTAPEVTPADPSAPAQTSIPADPTTASVAGTEPAPGTGAEPAASAPSADPERVPAHEPAVTVSREATVSPQPVEPK
jgi:Tat protein translocase TatB subunit